MTGESTSPSFSDLNHCAMIRMKKRICARNPSVMIRIWSMLKFEETKIEKIKYKGAFILFHSVYQGFLWQHFDVPLFLKYRFRGQLLCCRF